MAHSIINYQGDGVTNTWSINFTMGYASQDEVTAWIEDEVDGGDNQLFRTITWITASTVSISGAVPQVGEVLWFARTTDFTQPAHDFADGTRMTAEKFDDNQEQILHLIQEIKDGRFVGSDIILNGGGGTNGAPNAFVDGGTFALPNAIIDGGTFT